MKKEHRWLKAAIAGSTDVKITMPWTRGTRSRPTSLKAAPLPKLSAIAAR